MSYVNKLGEPGYIKMILKSDVLEPKRLLSER